MFPLMAAAMRNHADIASLLLEAGANVDATDEWGRTVSSCQDTRSPQDKNTTSLAAMYLAVYLLLYYRSRSGKNIV
jgi:ankyrin repeat protein